MLLDSETIDEALLAAEDKEIGARVDDKVLEAILDPGGNGEVLLPVDEEGAKVDADKEMLLELDTVADELTGMDKGEIEVVDEGELGVLLDSGTICQVLLTDGRDESAARLDKETLLGVGDWELGTSEKLRTGKEVVAGIMVDDKSCELELTVDVLKPKVLTIERLRADVVAAAEVDPRIIDSGGGATKLEVLFLWKC